MNKKLENKKRINDIYNDNRSEFENRKRMKDKEQQNRNNQNHNEYYDDQQNQNQEKNKKKEKMGRCCRCHRIFPRRLLTINRYFYKDNRK